MKPAEAGSARFVNEVVEGAYERLVPVMDALIEVLLGDGYPPLTEPVTVRNLLAMEPDQAAEQLRMMLEASTRWVPVPAEQVGAMVALGVPLRRGANGDVERSETEAETLRLVLQYQKALARREGKNDGATDAPEPDAATTESRTYAG